LKRNRILILLLWILSLVGISFYGGAVSYGFFIMVTMIPAMCGIYLLCVRLRFSIYQRLEGKTFVSRRAIPYYFTLQNEEWFAFASVKVYFHSDFSSVADLTDGEEYELLPGTGISRDTSLICRYRGTYRVGIRSVEITDFLRLFRMRYNNPEPLEVIILPSVIPPSELGSVRLARILTRELPAGNTVPASSVRDYIPGDPVRSIHWAASAKEQHLLVRARVGEEQQGVSILVGSHRFSEDPAVYLPAENRMLELSLSLARFFLEHRIPVRAYHCDTSWHTCTVSTNDAFDAYYAFCSQLMFHASYNDRRLFREAQRHPSLLHERIVFFVITDWSADAEQFARTLNASGVPVVALLVADILPASAEILSLPRTELVVIPPDADLREVL